MKELCIIKMVQKSTTKLSVLFVLVWMIFLVPVLTEKALGITEASAVSGVGNFYFFSSHLDDGKFTYGPEKGPSSIVSWTTTGTGIFGGDEKGYVKYELPGYGIATFYFSNPFSGSNSCGIEAPLVLAAKCSITPGVHAYAHYDIAPKGHPPISPHLGVGGSYEKEPGEDHEGDNGGDS